MYHLQVTVTLNLTSDLVFTIIISEAYLSFEVGIPNLECKCILEWQIVLFHFPVTVILTSDLVSRICISSIFFEEFQNWCVDASWDDQVLHSIFGSL